MSRREQIQMSDDEVIAFLDEERTVICATNGKDGFPHLMPLWYVVRGHRPPSGGGAAAAVPGAGGPCRLWAWTYAKSQKVRNLERDARATIQVETGTEYQELRGVMFKCDVIIHPETDDVAQLGTEIFTRYTGADAEDVGEMVRQQASKRVGLEFVERERATWDHRKLEAGVY
jgi:hypothetical protein